MDFGCGGGAYTWYLSREGFDTYAIDGSEYAVKNTKEKLENEGLTAHYKVCDGIDLGYENGYFDVALDNVSICSNSVLDIKKMYHQLYRVLKSGGKILTSCFGKETYGYGLGQMIEKDTYSDITDGPLKNRGIVHFFDEEEIRIILEKIGFKNILIDRFFYTDMGKSIEQFITQATK